jgi:hypothetical protein
MPAAVDQQFGGRPGAHEAARPAVGRMAFNAAESCVATALRHFDKTNAPDFEADLEEAACWMLVRACENAHRLGLTVQGFDAFNEWFCEHVVVT